ncbi:carboxypeptidase-like regulatory domain-containing protein [Flavobacterium sp. RHBU_3]|uniref:TonB-dependent receptor n=1 Tax=Flavobacterium sp. RHBU_3 TaxID=3391184 RepID=UPI0039851CA6
MKLRFLVILLLTFLTGLAQEKATLTGKVTDKDMGGEALPFASVMVKGTQLVTNTDETGMYTLQVPAGTYTIVFSFLGYENKEVKVTLAAGETKNIDQILGSSSVQLQDVVIEKVINREKETALLLEQKKAVEIKQSIGAQELSRKGIGDVEEGLTKITGITKVGSRGLFVRGLEDRYNNLLVNDLAVPSNNPFQKIIPLDLFPTDIVGVVDVYKTFSPNIYADFAGGTFNIATSKGSKEITKLSIGVGYTTNNNLSDFKISSDAHSAKGFFGLTGSDREMPSIFGNTPTNKTLTGQQSEAAFKSGFNTDSYKSPLNTSIGFLHSEKFDLANNGKLSYILSINADNSFQVRKGVDRTLFGKDIIQYNNNFYTSEYKYKTNTSALVGVNYKKDRFDVWFNTFYLRTTENSIQDQYGVSDNQVNNPNYLLRTNQLDQSDYITAQVMGKYFFDENKNQFVRAGGSFSKTSYSQPDRKFFGGTLEPNKTDIISSYGGNNFLRQYFDISSNFYFSGIAEYVKKFGNKEEKQHQFTVGYNGNGSESGTSYRFVSSFRPESASGSTAITFNLDNIDPQITSDLLANNGAFRESSNSQYKTELTDFINAGFANVLLHYGEKWEINAGVRAENYMRDIKYRENGSFNAAFQHIKTNKTYILPAASVKYSVSEKANFRFAAGQTYTKPVLIETLPLSYINADGTSTQGNGYLKNSDNYNVDLKYEIFPTNTEMFSVGVFGKKINNAIERTFLASAGGFQTTYENTGDATLYGVEADFILDLARLTPAFKDLSWGFNTSVMNTNIKVNDYALNYTGSLLQSVETHKDRQLQGASKWLINSDIKYQFNIKENWSNTLSLVYGVFGKRIFSVGTNNIDHIYELPVQKLDLVWGSKISEHFDFKLSAHNLLNPKVRFEVGEDSKGEYIEDSRMMKDYKRGVGFSLGLNYTF